MGQKVHPHGLRVGVIKEWDAKWFANKKDFADNLGWTKSVITEPKDRKLITLVNECQLEPFFGP